MKVEIKQDDCVALQHTFHTMAHAMANIETALKSYEAIKKDIDKNIVVAYVAEQSFKRIIERIQNESDLK